MQRYSKRPDLAIRIEKLVDMVTGLPSGCARVSEYRPHQIDRRLDVETKAQLVRDYQAGIPTTALTSKYSLSKATVLQLLRDADVAMRRQGLSEPDASEARRLYETGLSLARVGAELGYAPTSVANALRKAGVQLRGRHERLP